MRIYIYILNPLSLALVANIACQRQISRRRHITCAVSANIDLLEYLLIRFHSCFTHEYRLPIGKYHAVRYITCAFGANIDLLIIPSSTVAATTVRPLLGGAAPFSSRFQRATFPAIGKVYPTKLGRAERAKVGVWDGATTATDRRVLKRT